ncbi:MAG: hypothetical protein CMJ84_00895 [Planctomycetes bacterium]|jgi:hypothetical protein|nr:hypothetical protein [Planctomycetota bacterium]MDP6408567.1 hypothetical protein [Planctomycetota bacterium]
MPISRLVISLAACLLLGEGAVRLGGREDPDGNVSLNGHRLLPYSFPGKRLATLLDDSVRPPVLVHSPELGWRPRPGAISEDGLHAYDALGVRVADPARPTSPQPTPGVRRLVLVGDSFAHGNGAPFAESLGAHLEASLALAGERVGPQALFAPGPGHYASEANEVVARIVSSPAVSTPEVPVRSASAFTPSPSASSAGAAGGRGSS